MTSRGGVGVMSGAARWQLEVINKVVGGGEGMEVEHREVVIKLRKGCA